MKLENTIGKSQKIAIGMFAAFATLVILAAAVSAQATSSGGTGGGVNIIFSISPENGLLGTAVKYAATGFGGNYDNTFDVYFNSHLIAKLSPQNGEISGSFAVTSDLDPQPTNKVSLKYGNDIVIDTKFFALTPSVPTPQPTLPVIIPPPSVGTTLTLYVRDAYTQNPVQNAEVTLYSGAGPVAHVTVNAVATAEVSIIGKATTDANGKVSFNINEGGKYNLEVFASGYNAVSVGNLEIGEGELKGREVVKVVYLKPAETQQPTPQPTPPVITPPPKPVQPEPIVGPGTPPPFPEEKETVTAELNIKSGWNLVSIPGKFESTKSTCSKNPYGFVYLKEEGKYISINEAERTGISEKLPDYLSKNAFWIYGFESCRITFEITEYQTFNAVDIVQGWNLVPVTVDMKGLSLNDIKDGCTLKSAYRWEEAAQKWQKLNFNKAFSSDDLHKGALVKSENSCVLGGAKIVPPEFPPEEKLQAGAIKVTVIDQLTGKALTNAVVTVYTAVVTVYDKNEKVVGGGSKDTQGGAAVFEGLNIGDNYVAFASAVGYESNTQLFKLGGNAEYLTIYLAPTSIPTPLPIEVPTPRPIGGGGGGGQLADKVAIKAYVDFQDPYSARFYNQIWPQIKADFGEKVILDLRDYPLTSIHPDAEKAAEAFRCTSGNENYAQILFNNQQALDVGNLKSYSAKVNVVEQASFVRCLDSGEMKAKVSSYIDEGSQNGITGTPTFFIGSKTIVGAQPYENFRAAIDSALSG